MDFILTFLVKRNWAYKKGVFDGKRKANYFKGYADGYEKASLQATESYRQFFEKEGFGKRGK